MSTVVRMGLGPSTELDHGDSLLLPSDATLATLTPKPDLDIDCPFPSPNPDTDNTEAIALDDLANLPPLPSQSPNEIENLDPDYPSYRAMIHYYTLSPSSTLTQETHPTYVSRKSVLLSLEYFYTLRKHLIANLSILEKYPGTSLVGVYDTETTPSNEPWETTVGDLPNSNAHGQSDSRLDSSFEREAQKTPTRKSSSFTELERAQNEFAMHHIAINENLRAASSGWGCHAFGLPDPLAAGSDIRHDRNYFAHSFPTPGGKGICLKWAVKGKTNVYGKLLGLVEEGVCVLQGQLDDPEIWVSAQTVERERVEREAQEKEEREVREKEEREVREKEEREAREKEEREAVEEEEQDDGKEGVYEQEDDEEWMEAPQSMFSRVFDSLGGNVVSRYCFRSGVVRRAGWMLSDWLGGMLSEADAVALHKAEEGATGECGEGDDWRSQEYKSEDEDFGSQEYKTEDEDFGSQEYKVEDDEGYGSQDTDASPSQPDSGWGEPQW